MPKLTYENELPPADEFQKALAEAMANTNPVDDLLELANDLWKCEIFASLRFSMVSESNLAGPQAP